MNNELTEIKRLLENLICYGRVFAADYAKARVKVKINDRPSKWLPWTTDCAGSDRGWKAPEIGDQVVVLCPSGNPANGIITGILYQNSARAPAASAEITRTVFGDGMVLEHDRARKVTRLNALDSEGTLILEAKNIILRTGEEGYYHLDHHGRATRLTHKGGPAFEAESWQQGSVVTGIPDYGYQPPEVLTAPEVLTPDDGPEETTGRDN